MDGARTPRPPWGTERPRAGCSAGPGLSGEPDSLAAWGQGSRRSRGSLVGIAACPGRGPLAPPAHALPGSPCSLCDASAAAACDRQGAPEAPDPQPGVGEWASGRVAKGNAQDRPHPLPRSFLQALLLPLW